MAVDLTAVRAGQDIEAGHAGPPRLVGVVWALLVFNALGTAGPETILPVPRPVLQMATMGGLLVAFTLALVLNLRLRIRPSAYVFLLTLLLASSVISSTHPGAGYGALFRCVRLAVFVATLWLLTRWWDGSMTFVRHHIRGYGVVLASVAAGLVIAPGAARPASYDGRLVGTVWPLSPPQIGQFAAVTIGLTVLLALGRGTDRTSAVVVIVPAFVLLMLTHTRTATLGLLVGLVVAVGSLMLTSAAARRAFGWTVLCAGVAAMGFASALQTWFLRGQSQENFATLTGRAKVWEALLAAPRTPLEQAFGMGLGDRSFGGLPIDNSWLSVYHEQGLVGVVLVASFVIVLATGAVLRPPSVARACALFLVIYCVTASYTESGLGDASPYLMHLAVAASLLAAPSSPVREAT
jgi:hypothetical protein